MDAIKDQEKVEHYFATLKSGEIYRLVIDNTEKVLIEKALERSAGNQIAASKILGLNRNTLRSKIKKLSIDTKRFKI